MRFIPLLLSSERRARGHGSLPRIAKLASLALAVALTVTNGRAGTITDFAVITYNSGLQANERTSGGYTVGSKIQIGASSVVINSLGAQFLSGSSSIAVGLWNDGGSQLIASTTVQNTDTLYQGYNYASLGQSYTLDANTVYVLGAYLPSGTTFWDGNDVLDVDYGNEPYSGNTGVTITREVYDVAGSITYPLSSNYSLAGRWGPANAAFITPSGVPEIDPAGMGSVFALIGGALGLLERRRVKSA